MIWSGSRLNLCDSRLGPHVPFWRFLFEQSEPREPFPRISQISARIDIPVIVNPFLLQHIQICMSRTRIINVLQ